MYDKNFCLGDGNYAKVFKASVQKNETKKSWKHNFLLSCFTLYYKGNKSVLSGSDSEDENEIILKLLKPGTFNRKSILENEIICLLELRNEPHIIHIKHIGDFDIFDPNQFIGLEVCKGGDLFNYFEKRGKVFNENDAKIILKQLIEALEECHKHWIVHGDIKLENVGLLQENNIYTLKLLDFGGSYIIKDPNDENTHYINKYNITASPNYIPPELICNNKIKERELIFVDLWELGVLAYVLLIGNYPFYSPSNMKKFEKILSGDISWPKNISVSIDMKLFIENLLKKNPNERVCDLSLL